MNIKTIILAGLLSVTASFGQTTARVSATVGPNSDVTATDSWPLFRDALLRSMEEGGGFTGDPGNPASYNPLTTDVVEAAAVTFSEGNVTYWNGVFSPGAPYAAERGRRLHFPLEVVSATPFPPGRITWETKSSDPSNIFAEVGSYAQFAYSTSRRGMSYGPDNLTNTFDDVRVLSGSLTNVNANVFRTSGRGFGFIANNAADLAAIEAYVKKYAPFTITTTYRVFGTNGSLLAQASKTVQVVPTGTLPAASRLTIAKSGANSVVVGIGGQASRSYLLQSSPDLRTWSNVGTFAGTATVTHNTGGRALFYRTVGQSVAQSPLRSFSLPATPQVGFAAEESE